MLAFYITERPEIAKYTQEILKSAVTVMQKGGPNKGRWSFIVELKCIDGQGEMNPGVVEAYKEAIRTADSLVSPCTRLSYAISRPAKDVAKILVIITHLADQVAYDFMK